MRPAEPLPKKGLTCRECGAENPPDALECWICLRSDWRQDSADQAAPTTAPPRIGPRIAGLSVLIAICGVVGAITYHAPGAAALFVVCLVPAFALIRPLIQEKSVTKLAFGCLFLFLMSLAFVIGFASTCTYVEVLRRPAL